MSQHIERQRAAMAGQHTKLEDYSKMRRRLYTSNYTGIPVYLMDFGFGGFIGYGKGVYFCEVKEELMSMKKMYQ